MLDTELEHFKREINLVEYATVACGYQQVRRESSRSSRVLKHPQTGDKIVVARADDGHWIYFSVRNERDSGTIVDFVLARQRQNLGEIRKTLREWSRLPRIDRPPTFTAPELRAEPRDTHSMLLTLAMAKEGINSLYLNSRGLRPETLAEPRFLGSWKLDARSNVLFVHRDADGITGYEIKNAGFTGFATGGRRTLCRARREPMTGGSS